MMIGPPGTAEVIAGQLLTAPTQAGGGRPHGIGDGLDQGAIQLPALPSSTHTQGSMTQDIEAHEEPKKLATLTGFSSLWRIRHFDVNKMRTPPL
jgi:hypothetical protein